LGKFEGVPSKTPLWVNWKERKEFRDVEFGGVKFKALYNGYSIMVGGEDAGFDNYGYLKGSPKSYTGTPSALGSDGNSCAYLKINPRGATKEELAGFAWWLENMYLPRGTVAYLTKKDGNVEAIKRVLNRRGFRQVCWYTPGTNRCSKIRIIRGRLRMLTYWEIQMQVCLNLELLGMSYEVTTRLPLFRLRQDLLKLEKNSNNSSLISDTIFLLDELTRLRMMGFETRHKDGKYY